MQELPELQAGIRVAENKDYWLVNAGDTAVMADVEGPGCINHIWVTTFCREILGPSIQHPVLSGSVAPVTENGKCGRR